MGGKPGESGLGKDELSHYPLGPAGSGEMKRQKVGGFGYRIGSGGFAKDPGWAPGRLCSVTKVWDWKRIDEAPESPSSVFCG